MEGKQLQQMNTTDSSAKQREFGVGGKVYVRNYGQGQLWLPGEVVETTRLVSCVVRIAGGTLRCCHFDQLRTRHVQLETTPLEDIEICPSNAQPQSESTGEPAETAETTTTVAPESEPTVPEPQVELDGMSQSRWPKRVRKPPDRYEPSF